MWDSILAVGKSGFDRPGTTRSLSALIESISRYDCGCAKRASMVIGDVANE